MTRILRFAVVLTSLSLTTLSVFAVEKIFDPTRDSARDLVAAEVQARAEHKNILLDVGGNWCSWCHLLDRVLHQDTELNATLNKNFVVVHVNFSKENENQAFLSRFPKVDGFPFLFILAPDGKLLHAQPTDALEQDHKISSGYNRSAVLEMLTQWAPKH